MIRRAGPPGRPTSAGEAVLTGGASAAVAQHPWADRSDAALIAEAIKCRRAMQAAEMAFAEVSAELVRRWEAQEYETQSTMLGEELEQSGSESAWRRVDLAGRRAAMQIAICCGSSESWVNRRITLARKVPQRLPEVWSALQREAEPMTETILADLTANGELLTRVEAVVAIDAEKADTIYRETGFLTEPVAREVATQVLKELPGWVSHGKARRAVERLAAHADPSRFAERVTDEIKARSIRYRHLGYGISELRITGLDASIRQAAAAVEHLAHTSDPQGRTPMQHRTDAALDALIAAGVGTAQVTGTSSHAAGGLERSPSTAPDARINILVPLDVLLGADTPAELLNGGMIPAQLAREIIHDHGATGQWRCLYTAAAGSDQAARPGAHPTILGLGRPFTAPGYSPPSSLREYLILRDRTCQAPGCLRSAMYSDIDHVTTHANGGVTCDCNLRCLCRHHHALKHSRRGLPLPAHPAEQ